METNDQPQGVEAAQPESLLDRMMKVSDEPEPEEEYPEEQEGSPEESPEIELLAEEEQADEEITHNGETKLLTKTALKELAQKGFDYTHKAQILAEDRRVLAEQQQQANARAQFQNQFISQLTEAKAIETQLAQYKAVNWQQLAAEDPMQYLTLNQTHQDLKEQYNSKVNEINHLHGQAQETQAKQQTELLQREAQAMMQAIPEWKDTGKATAEMSELKTYLAKAEFSQQEITGIFDHRHVTIARKAMLYDKMLSAGSKKVQAAPPTAKPGVRQQNPNSAQDKDLRQRLKQTGSGDYAAKLIERML